VKGDRDLVSLRDHQTIFAGRTNLQNSLVPSESHSFQRERSTSPFHLVVNKVTALGNGCSKTIG